MARAEMTFTVKDIPEVKAMIERLTAERDAALAAIQRALVIWREHADGSGHPHPERCVCRACWMARALDGEVTP